MVTAWYTLVVGTLLTLNGIVFLMFSPDSFKFPQWYLGLLVLVGVVGIILGLVSAVKNKKTNAGPVEKEVNDKQ